MKSKKFLAVVACMVAIVFLIAACGGQASNQQADTKAEQKAQEQTKEQTKEQAKDQKQESEIMIGYAVMRMVDEFWSNQIDGIKTGIKESGKPLKLEVADNNNDGQTTLQNAESLIGRGAKFLIVSTPDPKVGGAIMEKAKAKNIPVIASDVPIEGAYFVTFDNFKAGAIVGEYAGKYFNDKFKGKKAKVAIITHAAVAAVVDDRIKGFEDAFKKAVPDATFLPSMDAEGLREKGANIMADIITANPDVNIMFGINDDIALGAASAVEARGLSDKIACFGQGGIGETSFKALLDPKSPFKATTAYMPSEHGRVIITDLILPLLDGKKPEQTIYSPLKLATPENAAEFLKK